MTESVELEQIIFNTVTYAIRRIGHDVQNDRWLGPIAYGYDSQDSWVQSCSRGGCDLRFAITKGFDITQRTCFFIKTAAITTSFPSGHVKVRELFEISIGSNMRIVNEFVEKEAIFPLDDKLLHEFVIGAKDCLCKRLTNFF